MQKRSLLLFYVIAVVFVGSSMTVVTLGAQQMEISDKLLTLSLSSLASLGTLLVPLMKTER
jgi:hypothetical protein